MKKTTFTLLLAIVFCSATSVRAADECCETGSVQQRFSKIDVKIALLQYEEIKKEQAKAQVQFILLETETSSNEGLAAMEKLRKRINQLGQAAHDVQTKTLKIEKEISVAVK